METTATGIHTLSDSLLSNRIRQATRQLPRVWQWRIYLLVLVINDVLMTGLAFRLAYAIRFEISLSIFKEEVVPNLAYYQSLVFILIPIWLLIFAMYGLYSRKNLLGGTAEYSRVFNATTYGLAFVIAIGFLLPEFVFARGWLLVAWMLAFLCTAIGRFMLRRGIYGLRSMGYFLSPAVIVGANDEGLSLAEQLMRWKTSGFHVLGFVDKKLPVGKPVYKHLYCLGRVEQMDAIIEHYGIEEIILASSAISSRDKLLDIFKSYGVGGQVNVRMSSGLYEIITTGLTVNHFAYVPLVGVDPVRLKGWDYFMKLALDYALTIPALLTITPVLGLIALIVKLDSPGPVLHRRRVMGVNGRQFDAFKFRTMYVNGDDLLAAYPELQEELATTHKLKNDPRVTRVGIWLRKWSLDELPQFINVLRGEMSIVGPRMISPGEIDMYNHWDINLLTVRPGITGLWQVSGRSDITYDERVRLDMYYIRNWSIWLDLQLLLQTIPAVLKKRGAY